MRLNYIHLNYKWWLGLSGILILFISLIYTNYLATQLAEGERDKIDLISKAFEAINIESDNRDADLTFQAYVIEKNSTIPLILADEEDNIEFAVNFRGERNTDTEYLKRQLERIKADGNPPFVINTTQQGPRHYIYYKHSLVLQLLTYFPIMQIILVGTFVILGFLGFSAARKAEQNRVWAGMAKETAHQLGTPINAIVGWVEVLNSITDENDAERKDIIDEMRKDIDRLELIADRFSKVGSSPELSTTNLAEIIPTIVDYMKRRAPRQVQFRMENSNEHPYMSKVNRHLFEWVIENLIRNSLDAMGQKGLIMTSLYKKSGKIVIDLSDSGKGISPGKFKEVFKPGYSTKKRGWGLGLSLAKRIIEDYHGGKIFVKESRINEGTTICIELPEAN
ncbi:MAG: sensor histidine kinase [Saprospirales bacterium]|nr:MAG: sensor histidine kinase [Saprospirales bacterium]